MCGSSRDFRRGCLHPLGDRRRAYADGVTQAAADSGGGLRRSDHEYLKTAQRVYLGSANSHGDAVGWCGTLHDRDWTTQRGLSGQYYSGAASCLFCGDCTDVKNENSVHDVLLAARAADAAIVGIGAINQKDEATIIRSGYITKGEQLMIGRKGAVGDILGYFFDGEGEVIPEMKIHDELIGLTLSTLKTIPTVIGVAGGE